MITIPLPQIFTLQVFTTTAGKTLDALPDALLLQAAEEYSALSKAPENAAGHADFLRAQSAVYLAALEMRRAFGVLRDAATGGPCECPDCLAKRTPPSPPAQGI